MKGTHITIDIHDIPEKEMEKILNPKLGEDYLNELCQMTNMTVIQRVSHSFGLNMGYTSLFLLAESHGSIHTYDEYCSSQVDFFTCKKLNQDQIDMIINFTKEFFGTDKLIHKNFERIISF